ncbi:MAG TPA: type II secretion system protein [Longimicrobiales bacterium]|nr:type II secretion system protein [Longimicrobiales bacterium]
MRKREGFTLLELMLVTVIIGVLATVMVAAYTGLKERGKLAVTRSELRNVMTAAEAYRSVTGTLPVSLDELVDGGFHRQSPNIHYCVFERQPGPPADLRVEAAHSGSTLHLVAQYPSWGVTTQQTVGTTDCS